VSGYSRVKVELWYYTVGMETGKSFLVEYYNGSNWQTVATYVSGTHFTNGSFYQVTGVDVVLHKGTYNFPANAKFKFRCNGTDSSDDVYIDEVKISAR
jgi:bacillolysin